MPYLARRWEIAAAIACAALALVPWLRIPAGLLLLCVIPGAAICRHWLGERDPVRTLLLGSVFSLGAVPAIAIPVSLVAGRPSFVIAMGSAIAATALGALGRRGSEDSRREPVSHAWALGVVILLAILMQAGMSAAMYPTDGVIQWKGMPDLIFFQGIYQQLTLHTPPMDPENGTALLVHNWIYQFHFALLHLATGLSIAATQQVAGAWMALVFLGMAWLVVAEILGEPAAAALACLLLMTSGEVTWLARSVASGSLRLDAPPWDRAPMGLLVLIGWYNLVPFAAGLAAWYLFQRHRADGDPAPLAASVLLCAATAFFHPVLYAAFMIGFCLWIAFLVARDRPRARWAWAAYLATPFPFVLLYKLPFYGMDSPPPVVHLDLHLAGVLARGQELAIWGGFVILAGLLGFALLRAAAGPLPWIALSLVALRLVLDVPNQHWLRDWMYIALAACGSVAVVRAARWRPALGLALAVPALSVGVIAFGLHQKIALKWGHTFSIAERAAGDWIRERTAPDAIFATMPNQPSIYTVVGLGQRKVTHGWTTHQEDFHHDAWEWAESMSAVFKGSDPDGAAETTKRFGADYLFLGASEKEAAGSARPSAGRTGRVVFSEGEVEILEGPEAPGRRSASLPHTP